MKYLLSEQFRRKYKKQDVRLQKAINKALQKFLTDHHDPTLDNHPLQRELIGMRSIDVTADHRAIYESIENGETVAYFETFGTHKELFQ